MPSRKYKPLPRAKPWFIAWCFGTLFAFILCFSLVRCTFCVRCTLCFFILCVMFLLRVSVIPPHMTKLLELLIKGIQVNNGKRAREIINDVILCFFYFSFLFYRNQASYLLRGAPLRGWLFAARYARSGK